MFAGPREEAGIQILLAVGLIVGIFWVFAYVLYITDQAKKKVKASQDARREERARPSADRMRVSGTPASSRAMSKEQEQLMLSRYGEDNETWPEFRFRVRGYESLTTSWDFNSETEEQFITRVLKDAGIMPRN